MKTIFKFTAFLFALPLMAVDFLLAIGDALFLRFIPGEDFWGDERGSISLSVAAIASFDADVKHAYQDRGKLRDTVRIKNGVVGSTHRFPTLGAGLATKRVKQTDVVPMNLQHAN